MKNIKSKILGAAAVLLGTSSLMAQPANTYFMDALPQSSYLNPGKVHQETFHMNFPMFFMAGHTHINYSNNGFAFNELIDSNKITLSNLVDTSGTSSGKYMNLDFKKDLFYYGWRKGKNFWTIGTSVIFGANVNFSNDFLNVLALGPGSDMFIGGDGVNLDGTRYDITMYQDVAIGFQREVNEKLNVGGRVRLLGGLMNYSGTLDGINVITAEDLSSLTVQSSLSVQTATPFDTTISDMTERVQSGIQGSLFSFSNAGVGVDIGGSYQINDQIRAYGSVVDLGLISWSDGLTKSNTNAEFVFTGIPVAELTDTTGESTFFDDLTDSIADIFKLDEQGGGYTTYLPTRFFAGGTYTFDDHWKANILYGGKLANGKLNSTVVVGGGVQVNKFLEATMNYTIKNGTYDNLGFGAVASLGAWQLYFVTDNILGLFAADYANNVNASLGMNLSFGRKKFFSENEGKASKGKKDDKKGDKKADAKPDMTPTITPENTPTENVEKMEKEAEKKADKAEDKADKAVDKAEDKADKAAKEAKKEEKSAEKAAEKKAEAAEKKAEKAEKKAEEKIQKAEEKAAEEKAKAKEEVREARDEAREAKNEAKELKEKAAATPAAPVVPEAAPAVPAANDSTKAVPTGLSTGGSGEAAGSETDKTIKSVEPLDALDKAVEEIKDEAAPASTPSN